MSPEQVRGKELDNRTDLFSLGAVLYEMATGKMPFQGATSGETCAAILHQPVRPASQLNPEVPVQLEAIIHKALERDRQLRYQHASELRADLSRLLRDSSSTNGVRSDSGKFKSGVPFATSSRMTWVFGGAGVAALLLWGLLWARFRRPTSSPGGSAAQTAIAVLPFQNAGSDKDIDFLRLALPDEIATSLSRVKSFSVRPFATTNKYNGPDVDLQQAGRAMGVKSIVTGHYLSEAGRLDITLEAVDVATNHTVWRDQVRVTSADSLAMRDQLISTVRQGLVPALGGAVNHSEAGTLPENKVAYDLYLHSLAMPHDAAPNKNAIVVLEQAVQLDPNYAPAWEALGLRYFDDAEYADGGEVMFKRSYSALERAVTLDPNSIAAATRLITTRTERGALQDAYGEALALINRFPDSSQAHFALSYVLRYSGVLDEAAHECETAFLLDPHDSGIRSCFWNFVWLGQYEKAMKFLELDRGSQWTVASTVFPLLGEGDLTEARQRLSSLPTEVIFARSLLEACLNPDQTQRLRGAAKELEAASMTAPDPELRYSNGTLLAYCGQKEAALRMLTSAVTKNFCAYEALQRDPLLAKLRESPEFRPLLSAAKACQNDFLAKRQGRP